MRIHPSMVVGAVLAATLHAPGLCAQSSRSLPPVGKHAVTFSIPNGGGSGFGIRKMRSAATNVGLEVQLGVNRQWVDTGDNNDFPPDDRTSWSLGLRPDVRMYRRIEGPVIPFLEWSGRLGYRRASGGPWALDGAVGVGLGVEWFPLEGMSISGSTGMAGTYSRSNSTSTTNNLALGLFRSDLILNLYF